MRVYSLEIPTTKKFSKGLQPHDFYLITLQSPWCPGGLQTLLYERIQGRHQTPQQIYPSMWSLCLSIKQTNMEIQTSTKCWSSRASTKIDHSVSCQTISFNPFLNIEAHMVQIHSQNLSLFMSKSPENETLSRKTKHESNANTACLHQSDVWRTKVGFRKEVSISFKSVCVCVAGLRCLGGKFDFPGPDYSLTFAHLCKACEVFLRFEDLKEEFDMKVTCLFDLWSSKIRHAIRWLRINGLIVTHKDFLILWVKLGPPAVSYILLLRQSLVALVWRLRSKFGCKYKNKLQMWCLRQWIKLHVCFMTNC